MLMICEKQKKCVAARTIYYSLVQINQMTMIKISSPPDVHSKYNNNFSKTIRSSTTPMAMIKAVIGRLHGKPLLHLDITIFPPLGRQKTLHIWRRNNGGTESPSCRLTLL